MSRVWAGSGGDRGLEMTSLSCYTLKYTIPPCPHCPDSDCAFLEFLPHPKPQDISVLFAAAEGFHSDSQVREGRKNRRPFLKEITNQLAGVSQRKHCIS